MAGEFDLVASALHADARDVDVFFDVLVGKLAQVLPEQVEVGHHRIPGPSLGWSFGLLLRHGEYELPGLAGLNQPGLLRCCIRRASIRTGDHVD